MACYITITGTCTSLSDSRGTWTWLGFFYFYFFFSEEMSLPRNSQTVMLGAGGWSDKLVTHTPIHSVEQNHWWLQETNAIFWGSWEEPNVVLLQHTGVSNMPGRQQRGSWEGNEWSVWRVRRGCVKVKKSLKGQKYALAGTGVQNIGKRTCSEPGQSCLTCVEMLQELNSELLQRKWYL